LAKVEDILQDLKNIVSSEKIKIADEELLLVAQAAQGSFRDGEKLLDQLSSMGKIDRETLEKMLLGSSFDAIAQLIGSIAKKNTTDSLRALHEQQSLGVVAKDLNLSLLELLRQLILIQNDLGEELVKIDVGVQKFEILVNLSKEFKTADLIKTLDNIQESLEKGKFVPIAYLPLEVAVVKSCLETKDVNQQVLPSEHVQELKEEVLSVAPAIIVSETSNIEINDSLDLQKIEERWTYILETARSFNYSLEALLRSVKIARCEEKLVVIEVPYAFHQRMLEVPKSRDMLESILSDILSRPIRISTILAKRSVKREDVANIEVAADDELVRLASEIFSADAPN